MISATSSVPSYLTTVSTNYSTGQASMRSPGQTSVVAPTYRGKQTQPVSSSGTAIYPQMNPAVHLNYQQGNDGSASPPTSSETEDTEGSLPEQTSQEISATDVPTPENNAAELEQGKQQSLTTEPSIEGTVPPTVGTIEQVENKALGNGDENKGAQINASP